MEGITYPLGAYMSDERKKPNIVWGGLFIAIGLLLFANVFFDLSFLSMRFMWPLFILIPGLFFEAAYFTNRKDPGLLVPGGILITIALLFFFEIMTGWRFAAYTWPVYILAVVVGLTQFSFAIGHPKGLVVAIAVLLIVAVTAMVSITLRVAFRILPYKVILPLAFIAIGGWFIYGGLKKK